jgi:hypothetical protein
MKIKSKSSALLSLLFVLNNLGISVSLAEDASARDIMIKAVQRDDGNNRISDMEMILIDKHNNERKRLIRSYTKDFNKDTYRILFFIKPADVKDTGFLTYDYSNPISDDDQWLYLPALRKTKRIASSDKSGSFMGSDFSYADMTNIQLDDYNFFLKRELKVNENNAWVIESIPRNKDVIEETGYTKSLLIVRQDIYIIVRAVHWLKKGERLKYMDVKNLELIGNIWTPTEIHMTTKKGKYIHHKTILHFKNTQYKQTLDKKLFTLRQLEKGIQ